MPEAAAGGARAGRPLSDRLDLRLIAEMVEPGSRVLDIGCGDGTLLDILVHERDVDGRGIEIDMELVTAAV
ncbi:MAG: methionine biosynthesis protein MetW, partial [Elioraea sp.]|nr:methionine biosynthesis protein MetW [Elioraea sp.]